MRFINDQRGAVSVEYVILLGGITLAIVSVVQTLGQKALAYFVGAGIGW